MSGELNLSDPSVTFGRSQGLFVYDVARAMDEDSERQDLPVSELAEDAARTAIRIFEASGINEKLAISGLMSALEERSINGEVAAGGES